MRSDAGRRVPVFLRAHALRKSAETQGRGLLRLLLLRYRQMSTEAGGRRGLRVRRVTRRRAQRPTAEESFRLPANISMHKEILPDGTAYVLRHRQMGVLGRIRIQERAAGGCHLVCETAGDPADPMTAQRAAVFEPLGLQLAALFPTDTEALARGVRPPPALTPTVRTGARLTVPPSWALALRSPVLHALNPPERT
jgi:hypothetical protein